MKAKDVEVGGLYGFKCYADGGTAYTICLCLSKEPKDGVFFSSRDYVTGELIHCSNKECPNKRNCFIYLTAFSYTQLRPLRELFPDGDSK